MLHFKPNSTIPSLRGKIGMSCLPGGANMKKSNKGGLLLVFFLCLCMPLSVFADIGIVNGLTHEKMARAGEAYETIIFIKNFGDKQERIKVYQNDFYFYADGRQFYSDPGELDRSNASWITYYPRAIVISAGETIELKCEVQVPDREDLVGTYWSMIMVEPVPEDAVELSANQNEQVRFGIQQVLRYGIQMITHIGDSGTREIKFLSTEFLKEDTKKILQVDVENIGQRWLRPVLYVEMFAENGDFAGKFVGGKWRIYPGTSVRYRVDLTQLPEGTYKAMIIVDNLDENVFGAEYSLDIHAQRF